MLLFSIHLIPSISLGINKTTPFITSFHSHRIFHDTKLFPFQTPLKLIPTSDSTSTFETNKPITKLNGNLLAYELSPEYAFIKGNKSLSIK